MLNNPSAYLHIQCILLDPHCYKWTTKLTPITVGEFEEQVGPTFRVGNTAMSVFSHMFPATIVESIVKETNRYAHQEMGDEKFAKWQPIDSNEFNAYLGFNILMGLVRLPELEDYWKNDPYFNYPPISDKISRTRFRHISQFMHFVDNDVLPTRGEVGYDRLGKIKPIITGIADAIQAAYSPGKEVSVDEAMIPFQGRSSLKQFLPLKPIKRGIKVWSLADSNNGYIHRFDVYTGKGSGTEKDAGLGESVVLNLTSHLQEKNHHVYCDNFFSSPKLCDELLQRKLYACGTCGTLRTSMLDAYQGTCDAFVQAIKEHNPSMLKKKKVHLVLHLPAALREFGPTSAYNTERYTN